MYLVKGQKNFRDLNYEEILIFNGLYFVEAVLQFVS